MRYEKYLELEKQVDRLCGEESFAEALAFLKAGLSSLPAPEAEANEFRIAWEHAAVCTMCNEYDECLAVIKGIVDKGYAFPLSFERFVPLKQKEGYKETFDKNNKLLEKEKALARARYEVYVPNGFSPERKYPLFAVMHGHGICNIEEFREYWTPDVFLARGFIFAYIQSSQVLCHNGFGWMDDYDKSNSDISGCIEAIMNDYPVDKDAVLLGGYSGGAIAAVNLSMSGLLPVKGFICVCPEEKPPAFTRENVKRAARSGMRGVFMEGELVLPVADEDEMLEIFREEGLPVRYYINKSIGHETPKDLDARLDQALEFICGEDK